MASRGFSLTKMAVFGIENNLLENNIYLTSFWSMASFLGILDQCSVLTIPYLCQFKVPSYDFFLCHIKTLESLNNAQRYLDFAKMNPLFASPSDILKTCSMIYNFNIKHEDFFNYFHDKPILDKVNYTYNFNLENRFCKINFDQDALIYEYKKQIPKEISKIFETKKNHPIFISNLNDQILQGHVITHNPPKNAKNSFIHIDSYSLKIGDCDKLYNAYTSSFTINIPISSIKEINSFSIKGAPYEQLFLEFFNSKKLNGSVDDINFLKIMISSNLCLNCNININELELDHYIQKVSINEKNSYIHYSKKTLRDLKNEITKNKW